MGATCSEICKTDQGAENKQSLVRSSSPNTQGSKQQDMSKNGLLRPQGEIEVSVSLEGGIPVDAMKNADWLYELELADSLFDRVGKFLKSLPADPKQHIWSHSVKQKQQNGEKAVVDTASTENQVSRLLCDCVIVFVKYMDRQRTPLSRKLVLPVVSNAAKWVFQNYGPIVRSRFESEKSYFGEMLEEYQQATR
jgi:hypothetical protein